MRQAHARGAAQRTAAVYCGKDGALAQLVERYTGSVEVRGSTPLGSTIFKDYSTNFTIVFAKLRPASEL
jgi:hypothetical protein